MTMKHLMLSIVALAAYGCKTPGDASLDTITLTEGACFGTCPVYSITIKSNDTYELDGVANTRTLGVSAGALPPGSWSAAQAAITEADFFNRPSVITPDNPEACGDAVVADLPSAEVSVTNADIGASSFNSIRYYPGCFNSPHKPPMDLLLEKLRDAARYSLLVAPAP